MTTRLDAKAGHSTTCRRGDHEVCKSLGGRCSCTCHGRGGQQPAPPSRRIGAPPPDASDIVVWEDPPPLGQRGQPILRRLATQLTAVRDHPDTWARIAAYASKSGAASAHKKLQQTPPPGNWEFRHVGDGSGSMLYARFLGD